MPLMFTFNALFGPPSVDDTRTPEIFPFNMEAGVTETDLLNSSVSVTTCALTQILLTARHIAAMMILLYFILSKVFILDFISESYFIYQTQILDADLSIIFFKIDTIPLSCRSLRENMGMDIVIFGINRYDLAGKGVFPSFDYL